MTTYCILDLETQNVPYYGHASSPHCPDNYVVAAGWAWDGDAVQSAYFYDRESADQSDWAERALKDARILVAHNATFELHWLLGRYSKALLDFLRRGGRVFCTQYAQYLLDHQTEMYPTLEDTAIKHGGTNKLDAVKVLWEQGVLTADIEEDLLMEYLAGATGDVENTRLICFSQLAQLKANGMLAMFWQRMDSLVFNAFATFNGLKVDVEVAQKNQKEHAAELAQAYEALQQYLPDIPAELEFNWGSDYHLSALIFGGTIKYRARVSYTPKKWVKVDAYLIAGSDDQFVPVECADTTQQYVTYKAGKNKGLPKVFSVDSSEELLKWGEREYRFKGLLKFSELPADVAEMYTGKRAQFRGKRNLVCGTPVYSTSRDSLQVLRNFIPFARELQTVADLDKDLGTYYITHQYDSEGNIKSSKGMLALVRPDGIVNHSLNNCATVTARLSSTKPNLQNLPRDGTSRVKQMFVSRFTGGKLVEVDYTSLEVIVGAAHSHDHNLLQRIADGTDMHCYRLAGFFDLPYEEVLAKATDKAHPEYKEWHEKRTWIKPITFANQYGASVKGLAYACGITEEQAQRFKDTELKLFPQMASYAQDYIRPIVERTGAHCVQREMSDAGVFRIYHRGYYQAPSGTCYSFREREKYINGQTVMAYKDTEIANYWCQGEASFIVQAACGRVIRALLECNFEDGKVLPINTVHDAIYLDCASKELAIKWGRRVQQIMEATPKELCTVIPALTDVLYNEVHFPAVAEYGDSLFKKKGIDDE